jgi:hypothetical protein
MRNKKIRTAGKAHADANTISFQPGPRRAVWGEASKAIELAEGFEVID